MNSLHIEPWLSTAQTFKPNQGSHQETWTTTSSCSNRPNKVSTWTLKRIKVLRRCRSLFKSTFSRQTVSYENVRWICQQEGESWLRARNIVRAAGSWVVSEDDGVADDDVPAAADDAVVVLCAVDAAADVEQRDGIWK